MELLIVDDDICSAKILAKIIETMNHKVLLAENGLCAWELLQKTEIRIVITDWMMPHMDGLTLCRKIRESDLSYYIYLILLTAKDRKEDAMAGLEAGADDYIVKPFDLEELKIRLLMGQKILRLQDYHRKAQMEPDQSEKRPPFVKFAAGLPREMKTPAWVVNTNRSTLSEWQNAISALTEQYRKLVRSLRDSMTTGKCSISTSAQMDRISALESELGIEFIFKDIPKLTA